MRNENDIKHVRIELAGTLQLDLERVEEDPVSGAIQATEQFTDVKAALEEYVRRYLAREVLLAECPATCGPVSIYGVNVTVVEPSQKPQETTATRDRDDRPPQPNRRWA